MLVIKPKEDEAVQIGPDILVTVLMKGGKPLLGIAAPKEVPIDRVPNHPKRKRLTLAKPKR